MRSFLLLSVVCLAGCAQPANQEIPQSDAEPMAETPASGAIMAPGLYEVGDDTTVYGRTRLNADGTYVDLAGDDVVGGGAWRDDGTEICFDPEGDGEDQQERCWTNGSVSEDGSFVTTRTDGSQSYKVTPIGE